MGRREREWDQEIAPRSFFSFWALDLSWLGTVRKYFCRQAPCSVGSGRSDKTTDKATKRQMFLPEASTNFLCFFPLDGSSTVRQGRHPTNPEETSRGSFCVHGYLELYISQKAISICVFPPRQHPMQLHNQKSRKEQLTFVAWIKILTNSSIRAGLCSTACLSSSSLSGVNFSYPITSLPGISTYRIQS